MIAAMAAVLLVGCTGSGSPVESANPAKATAAPTPPPTSSPAATFSLSEMRQAAARVLHGAQTQRLDPPLIVQSVDEDAAGAGIVAWVAYVDPTLWKERPQVPVSYAQALRRLAQPVTILRIEPTTGGPAAL
jgi:hypothetical protein